MKIFVYEYITSGGPLEDGVNQPFPRSLLREGHAMLEALARDFAAIDGIEVTVMVDARIESDISFGNRQWIKSSADHHLWFDRLAGDAEKTVVIAPEFDGILYDRTCRVVACRGTLLGPSPDIVELTSDKHRTSQHLAAAGIPIVPGRRLSVGDRLPADAAYPAVLKRLDGAGSLDVVRIDDAGQAGRFGELPHAARLEPYLPGLAASVSVLCGPQQRIALIPCCQRLSQDGRFQYAGGHTLQDEEVADRARRLAQAAVETLESPLGYVGVDLLLGDTAADDIVLEINPRLTTSYVGLRAAYPQNLADAMLQVADGRRIALPEVVRSIEFDADGAVRFAPDA